MSSANSVDPYQTPRITASDLGLHFLPMSHLWKNGLLSFLVVINNNFHFILFFYLLLSFTF